MAIKHFLAIKHFTLRVFYKVPSFSTYTYILEESDNWIVM